MPPIVIEKKYHSFRKEEFEDYFNEIGHLISPGCYSGDGWEVIVEDETIEKIRNMDFVAVKIKIKVNPDKEENFIDNLRLAFLRGGG